MPTMAPEYGGGYLSSVPTPELSASIRSAARAYLDVDTWAATFVPAYHKMVSSFGTFIDGAEEYYASTGLECPSGYEMMAGSAADGEPLCDAEDDENGATTCDGCATGGEFYRYRACSRQLVVSSRKPFRAGYICM